MVYVGESIWRVLERHGALSWPRTLWVVLKRFVISLVQMLLLSVVSAPSGMAQDSVEADVLKVAYVFNFAKLTQWPPTRLPSEVAPLVFCFEKDAVRRSVIDGIADKKIGSRPVETRLFQGQPPPGCHVVFLGEDAATESIAAAVRYGETQNALTVSEAPGFLDRGGHIALFEEQERLRFNVNFVAVQANSLNISSKLLALAAHVRKRD